MKELHKAIVLLIAESKAGCGDAIQNFVNFYNKWLKNKEDKDAS